MIAISSAGAARAADNYVVVFDGAPADIAEALKKITYLSTERRPYPTSAAIRRVAREDVTRIRDALQAAGYFAAKVDFDLEDAEADQKRMRAVFRIKPGRQFKIAEHVIVYQDDEPADRPHTFDALKIKVSEAADGATLQKNHQAFLAALWGAGYPSARITARRVEIRPAENYARAVYSFETGARSNFGEIVFTGNERTKDDFLTKLKTWQDEEIFDRAKLVSYRDRLGETGLFSSVNVEPGPTDANGEAPVLVDVEERKRRTVGAGLSYSTTEGPGGRLFLEYRNLFKRGERARVDLAASGIEQSATFDLNKPLPAFPGDMYANFSFTNETTDAYNARSIMLGGGASRNWLDDRLETRAGLAFETSGLDAASSTLGGQADDRTYFVSLPLSATWNTEDDPLSLSRGVNASLRVIPYVGSDQFTRVEAAARSRTNFGSTDKFTIAARTRVVATLGSSLTSLPVNKRVYAGGGASIRGYGYQAVGPLDAEGVPLGGRSVVEGALETRARISQRIQLAAFTDAGVISPDAFPSFDRTVYVGAGGGVRYLSPIGPIRADIAFPLEKRATDSDFQIYISLGQPF